MKKLGLKKETLVELSIDELSIIAGGVDESQSCTPTYTCVNVSGDSGCNSFGCVTYTCFPRIDTGRLVGC
jgi:hypothetical protein